MFPPDSHFFVEGLALSTVSTSDRNDVCVSPELFARCSVTCDIAEARRLSKSLIKICRQALRLRNGSWCNRTWGSVQASVTEGMERRPCYRV